MAQIQVRDRSGRGIGGITIRIAERDGSNDAAIFDYETDEAGNKGWPIPYWPDKFYTLHVNMRQANGNVLKFNPKFAESSGVLVEPGDHNVEVTLPPAAADGSSAGQAGRLQTGGPIFRVEGQPWRFCGVDGYALGARIAAGDDVTDLLDWYVLNRFNTVRVFLALKNITDQLGLPPFLATQDQIHQLLTLLTSRGLRAELTAGDLHLVRQAIDPTSTESATTWQRRRLYAPWAEVASEFDLQMAETCNEPFKNGVDVKAIGRLGGGIVQASGVYDDPVEPILDYITRHPGRDDEWPRKGKDAYDYYQAFKVAVVNDESMGADEVNKPGSRSNVPEDFFDCGACDALMGAGGTFHATDLVYARLPGEKQQECAEAYVAGQLSIPLEAPLGQYSAGHLSTSPLEFSEATSLRTFSRIDGGKATSIVIRPKSDTRTARDGWRIVGQRGPGGRVVDLAR